MGWVEGSGADEEGGVCRVREERAFERRGSGWVCCVSEWVVGKEEEGSRWWCASRAPGVRADGGGRKSRD